MVNAVAVAEECADSEHLSRPSLPFGPEFGEAPVVVFDGGDVLAEGDVEVVVEVAAEGGVPGDGPAHPLPEWLDLGQRRPADEGQGGIPGVQVRQVADAVGQERAGRAALVRVRVEHEMVDQQLTPALEQLQQAGLAVRALELVLLADLGHRHPAPLSVQCIALPGELFLPGQQLLAGREPLLSGHDRRIVHSHSSLGGCPRLVPVNAGAGAGSTCSARSTANMGP